MKTGNPLRLLALLASFAALPGCASLSESECLNADWEDIGIRDGANGKPEEYLIEHSTACAKVNVAPDRERWLRGREQGLDRFCLPQKAYEIGEWGGNFEAGICRNYDLDRLANAFERGRDVHHYAEQVSSLDSEIHSIRGTLKQKDLEQKERERLIYRLGQLEYERDDAQRNWEMAKSRARNL